MRLKRHKDRGAGNRPVIETGRCMVKYIFEGIVPAERGMNEDDSAELSIQDGGHAKIATISGNSPSMFVRVQSWESMFVRVQSWEDERDAVSGEYTHADFNKMLGKRVRVTVEVVED